MGQSLSEPVITKQTDSCSNSAYAVGSSCMQGWRPSMEDAHTHILSLDNDADAAYFAVFDGHNGSNVSKYVCKHLHSRICLCPLYAQADLPGAIKQAFLELDQHLLNDRCISSREKEMSGTTAIIVLVKNGTIYCGNAGDSRAVASVAGKAVPLSKDHKPDDELESLRIHAAGSCVERGRLNGNALSLSRAFGDFGFKHCSHLSAEEQAVTACPDVQTFHLTPDFEFFVLACDGIWDVMTNEQVVSFCREKLIAGIKPELVCEELMNRCLAKESESSDIGCDNMTVILVCLLQGCDQDKYIKRISTKN
ncbi:protein phosphatase 2C domain-containing protein [Ditylenchus destructor]|nr:protein phosphatase 2C domain-containing protein [Ditylenchus destructor]